MYLKHFTRVLLPSQITLFVVGHLVYGIFEIHNNDVDTWRSAI